MHSQLARHVFTFSPPSWFKKVQYHLRKEVIELLMEHTKFTVEEKKIQKKAKQLLFSWDYWTQNAQANPQKVFQVIKKNVEPFQKFSNLQHQDIYYFPN